MSLGYARSAQLRGAGYSSSGKTLTATGMETFLARPLLSNECSTLHFKPKDGLSPVKPSATAMGFLHPAPVGLVRGLSPKKGYRPGESSKLTPGLRGFHYPSFWLDPAPLVLSWSHLERAWQKTRLTAPAWVSTLEYRLVTVVLIALVPITIPIGMSVPTPVATSVPGTTSVPVVMFVPVVTPVPVVTFVPTIMRERSGRRDRQNAGQNQTGK
jgi:hypothetical protein